MGVSDCVRFTTTTSRFLYHQRTTHIHIAQGYLASDGPIRTQNFTYVTSNGNNPQYISARKIPIKTSSNFRQQSDRELDNSDGRYRDQPKAPDEKNTPPEDTVETNEPMYTTHLPTNFIQKAILSVGAAGAALLDPRRHDMVAVLGETTGHSALSHVYNQMIQDDEGQQVLMERPRINGSTLDLPYLSTLPEGTLGHAYIRFLEYNKVTPDSRLAVQFVDDPELAYVMQRYREGHDLYHTILGMPTNMLGEVAVKWVEAIQTGLPMCFAAAVFGPLRFKPKQRQKYISTILPWAMHTGRSSKLLMNMYFEKRWEQSINEIRKEFGIEPPPKL
ncbi:hypothetical protein Pcinc_020368 [Petrolisthes cinctipes]|uniref:Ubiquinone biosynthesis protein COQ4 homolog, mitochondrial n=1 Tax=Petrolisthes cinctipes TaxID=88211 RepID=A0AAE1FKD2_PETCI|nr:hypothetical protein Pcinc_020368 [Petrolisthes cinctipes]